MTDSSQANGRLALVHGEHSVLRPPKQRLVEHLEAAATELVLAAAVVYVVVIVVVVHAVLDEGQR